MNLGGGWNRKGLAAGYRHREMLAFHTTVLTVPFCRFAFRALFFNSQARRRSRMGSC